MLNLSLSPVALVVINLTIGMFTCHSLKSNKQMAGSNYRQQRIFVLLLIRKIILSDLQIKDNLLQNINLSANFFRFSDNAEDINLKVDVVNQSNMKII